MGTERKRVKADWQTSKRYDEILKTIASIYATIDTILASDEKAVEEVAKTILINKEYYADLAIDSPKDLTHAIAEYTSNVLGIKVSTVDSDTGSKSSIVFEGGGLINKLVTIQNLSYEVCEKLVTGYKNGLADLGAYFGYVTEVSSITPDFIVSFRK